MIALTTTDLEMGVSLTPDGFIELESIGSTRVFSSGATRDQDTSKFDYEGFLSPLVVERFAGYMHHHRIQPDGTTRDSDNWQKGIPLASYMKSMWRHLITVWHHHRGLQQIGGEDLENALCGVIFNAQGYLHEVLKEKEQDKGELLPF